MGKNVTMKWKRGLAFLLSLALTLTMIPDVWFGATVMAAEPEEADVAAASEEGGAAGITFQSENIAWKATAGADYSNTGADPGNVNNGYLATDKPGTTWNTWKKGGATDPAIIWLEWKVSQELDGMRVIWWADNANKEGSDNVTFPKSCTVEYLNDSGNWTQITGMTNEGNETTDQVGVLYNSSDGSGVNGANKQWNTVKFKDKVKTKKLRLKVSRSGTGDNGVGISEWEVFGSKSKDAEKVNIAGEATAEADYANSGSGLSKVNDGQLGGSGSGSTWNTWKKEGNLTYPYPITLKWKHQRTLSSMKVMWWADDVHAGDDMDGVMFPKSCEAEYWNGTQWVKITGMTNESGKTTDTVGVKCGSGQTAVSPDDAASANYTLEKNRYWNEVKFADEILTNQVRLLIARPDGTSIHAGIGIGEWEVYGDYEEDPIVTGFNIAPKANASADYENTDTSVDNVNNMALGGEKSNTSWNTWNKDGNLKYPQPVTLTWEEPYDITSMRVMWWADDAEAGTAGGDGVLYPGNCKAQYWDYVTNDWKDITAMQNAEGENADSVGVAGNGTLGTNRTWNGVIFKESVKTTALRLLVDRPANAGKTSGIGIGEWEVFGKEITDEFIGAKITGKKQLLKSETSVYYAESIPKNAQGEFSYKWEIPAESKDTIQIVSQNDEAVSVKALKKGSASINLEMTSGERTTKAAYEVSVDEITTIDPYVTTTTPGKKPVLPDSVVANGVAFDDPTPSLKSTTKNFDFGEDFNSKLMPVTWKWNEVQAADYDEVGDTFTVKGIVPNTELEAEAKVTVKKAAAAAVENSTVTFENVELTDKFWLPKQKVNALNSLNKAIYQIQQSSGGEPNFDNAIKKLNGEPYEAFSGLVFQDTDIYKTLEAISYTLSVIKDEKEDEEIIAQKAKLEKQLDSWIEKIEKVQYADGYINTHFTLRAQGYEGGRAPGTHRWRNMSNHEMYVAGHFLESVVAYTRYREGTGNPDYRLYIAGRRFADHIVDRFGPNGTRHEVPGHEEIELALVKFAKLVEEYEGEGTGDKYVQTAKTLIDRRGEDYTLRESGYRGYNEGQREYSQDATPFANETNAVGHAVRATYLYTGATDVARLLPDDDPDKAAYMNTLDNLWDSVAKRKTYITGGIGVASKGEDFGGDYQLPNNDSYCEICASISLANWNQRMNLVHEDSKYADVMERTLYNGILVGTNLEGTKFYYANKLEIPKAGGSTDGGMYGGVQRQDWFNCACCPPNLMRTIAKLSEYMYTVHGDNVYVNLFVGSNGKVNVDGTEVNLVQKTEYPWGDGSIGITVNPQQTKEFTMNIRIPGWVKEQVNRDAVIEVIPAGETEADAEKINMDENKGYVPVTREWKKGDVIKVKLPMEIRKTETNPNIKTNQGKIAIERGPIVYALEKAGNAQLNKNNISESDFDPRNFVIPRDAELTANRREAYLKDVMMITGNVKYKDGNNLVDAKLQAVPFYASNNRGDTDEYQPNGKSTRMTVWTNASGDAPVMRTVTFDTNGGTLSENVVTIRDGQTFGTWSVPTRKYHRFLGWFTAKEGGDKVEKDTVITKDMTLYAHWETDNSITFYTITFDANGGKSPVASIDREPSEKVGTLPTPTKAGSEFLGWFTAKEGGEPITKDTLVSKSITAYAHWNDPDVAFGASGSQTNVGADNAFLIAVGGGGPSTDGNNESAAYAPDITATGGNNLGSTRVGCLVFKLQDAWRNLDLDKIKATVTINVVDINHELGSNKTKAGLFAVSSSLGDIKLTDATTYPAKNDDYSRLATIYSKEWIAKTDLGKKTFDVTEIVKELLEDGDASHAIFRLQTVTSGFLVTKSGADQPKLEVVIDSEKKEQGSLTITCPGFTYDGTATPAPKVAATTNEGADVFYTYYKDEACKEKINPPVNAGTYWVKGTAEETDQYKKVTSEAVKFEIAPKKVEKATVTGIVNQVYTGKALTQPNMKVDGYQEGVDYTVSYANNVNVGKATVTITFQGNYTGAITAEFQITQTQQGSQDPQNPIPAKNKTYKSGNYQYKVTKSAAKGGTVELKAPLKKTMKTVSVPSTVKINGYTFKVTSIGKNAFKNNKKLTKATIGANVTKIGANAFSGCKKLKKITVKTKKLKTKSIGKNAFKNIYKKAVISVPKSKKKAYKKVFKGKGQKKTVKIK